MAFIPASPVRLLRRQRPSSRLFRSTCAMSGGRPAFDASVYVVTDRAQAGRRGVAAAVAAALRGDGGKNRATMVQLRDKSASRAESLALGRELVALTRAHGARLVVNDDVDLAEALDADGVHVGQEDAPARLARPRVRILGVSAGTPREAERAVADGADYVGVGAVFGTSTKHDAGEPIGVAALAAIVDAVAGRIPVVAIGGVNAANAAECIAAGADGVAVVSAVMKADDPAGAAARIARKVAAARARRQDAGREAGAAIE